MKTDESTIKAEEIDGYRGGEDLESLLQFIESKPKRSNPDLHPSVSLQAVQVQQGQQGQQSEQKLKAKRSRPRTERKAKRSRTPSLTTSSKEKSPDTNQSQKTS